MAILCSFDTCEYFSHWGCGHPRKKKNGGKFILPNFNPGKSCIWGKQKFDAADFIRAHIAIMEAKRDDNNT